MAPCIDSQNADGIVRRARDEDCAFLSDLAFRAKASWGYSDEFMAACRGELVVTVEDVHTLDVFVLERAGRVQGYYALEPCGDGEVEMVALFVEPELNGQGHGKTLVEHAKELASSQEYRSIVIQSDPYAEPFYRSCGAVRIGTRPSDSIPGRQLPLMKIVL